MRLSFQAVKHYSCLTMREITASMPRMHSEYVKMNMKDGGKNAKPMRSTFIQDAQHANGGWYQLMITENGIPKGLRSVLTEGGLWPTTGP